MIGKYISSKTETLYQDLVTGKKFWQVPEYLDVNMSSNEKRDKRKNIIRREEKEFNEWFAEKHSTCLLLSHYQGRHIKVNANCPKHGNYPFRPNGWGWDDNTGNCPKCSKESRRINNQVTFVEFLRRLKNAHGARIRVSPKSYQGISQKARFKCTDCENIWEAQAWAVAHQHTHGCPVCAATKSPQKVSQGEQNLFEFIKKYFPDATQSRRDIITPFELDIYIPSCQVAIDYNGLYWHSDLHKEQSYHADKRQLCLQKGIRLLFIYEDDWRWNRAVVKRTLRYLLGIEKVRLYARKFQIQFYDRITPPLAEFYNRYHMQGTPKQGVTFTLEDPNRIVAAMTFCGVSSVRGTQWHPKYLELIRFATYGQVIGGASRLFAAAQRKFSPQSILSFSDNDLFDGNLYQVLGFHCVKNIKPDYKVWFGDVDVRRKLRCHKSAARRERLKSILGDKFDPNKSERVNCHANGIFRIFDSGKKKWLWERA